MRWIGSMKTLAIAAGVFAAGCAWAAPQIDVFTPQGQAKGVRQVAVRFSEPMVAFGDPRLPDPFSVRCDGDPERLKGRGGDQQGHILYYHVFSIALIRRLTVA